VEIFYVGQTHINGFRRSSLLRDHLELTLEVGIVKRLLLFSLDLRWTVPL